LDDVGNNICKAIPERAVGSGAASAGGWCGAVLLLALGLTEV